MKRIIYFLMTISMLLCAGCSDKTDNAAAQEKTRPVKVTTIEEESYPVTLEYIGTITSDEIKKYSFKSPGKVGRIYVEKGQRVKKGDVIASLDDKDLLFAVEAAQAQMLAAQAQYQKAVNGASQEDINNAKLNVKKAQDTHDFVEDTYEKMVDLYDKGSISKQQLDESKLKLDNSISTLNQAKELLKQVQDGARAEDEQALLSQFEAAKTNYEHKKSMLDDARISSDVDGYIVDVLNEEGEIAAAGYPVAVIRSEHQTVQTGVSQKDVKKVEVGMKASVDVDGVKGEGVITNIAQMPDRESRTYTVEIELTEKLSENDFYLGAIAKISIQIGNLKGVWVSIPTIMNNGEDYVYVVENERVVRKNLQLGEIHEEKVSVKGLTVGEQLIIEGMKNLKDGYKVSIQQ
ncbi:MAG: efflux RND transporter periplasmic adaptor subunit [Firmicutes bacterium]|nr:efflux RND transporter periplasmic adaptor subunit [Bacillota bacterium]